MEVPAENAWVERMIQADVLRPHELVRLCKRGGRNETVLLVLLHEIPMLEQHGEWYYVNNKRQEPVYVPNVNAPKILRAWARDGCLPHGYYLQNAPFWHRMDEDAAMSCLSRCQLDCFWRCLSM